MAYAVTIIGVLLLYVAGMVMSLVGPSQGRLFGALAFILTLLLLGILSTKWRRGTLRGLFSDHASTERIRQFLHLSYSFCLIVFVAAFVTHMVSANGAGVADGTRPIFDHQDEYRLSDHENYTSVSRTRYLVVGSSFVIAWHAFGMFALLFSLRWVLFADSPPGFDNEARRND